jgi:hypothetical protein
VRSRPSFSTRTSAEKPGSAISASGTPVSGLTHEPALGRRPFIARGQLIRTTPSWSNHQGIGQVVDQDRDPDTVDRLELDRHRPDIPAATMSSRHAAGLIRETVSQGGPQ